MNIANLRPYLTDNPKKAYTILGMTLLAISGFGFFAIRPTVTTAIRLNRERKEGLGAVQALEKKLGALSMAKQNLEQSSAQLELLEKAMPEDMAFDQLLESLASIAGENEVELQNIKSWPTGEKENPAPLKSIHLTLTLSGYFNNVESTILSLERLPRATLVEAISVKPVGTWGGSLAQSGQTNELEVEVTLNSFYYE